MSYIDFFRWELASVLDRLAEKYAIHAVGLAPPEGAGDAVYDIYDLTLRMSKPHTVLVHEQPDVDDLLAMVQNTNLLITDNRELAAIGRRSGASTIFLSSRFRRDVPEAKLYGPGFIEPFGFSAAALEGILPRLSAMKPEAVRAAEDQLRLELAESVRGRNALIVA